MARPSFRLILALILVVVLGSTAQASSVITHGSRSSPRVALTFDDGWSASRCESIVRTLRAKRAPATFFINGAIMRREPARWRAMLDGFEVANHTLTHAWLTRLSASSIRSQVATNEQVIEGILGRSMLPVLRPPYGAYDSEVVQVADSLGYRTLLWDVDSYDTRSWATTSSVIRYGSSGGRGSIVLMHCGPAVTPGAVAPIIDSYRSRGYQLVSLGQLLGMSPSEPPDTCWVRNRDTGVIRDSLQAAVDAARPGARLALRGSCEGSTRLEKSISIRGVRIPGSGAPTLVGKGRRTVLTIASAVATVAIDGLTIRGGASAGKGGGIRNRGRLILRGVTVRGNTAQVGGGGIYNGPGAVLHIKRASLVRGNEAADGGGVWNAGSLRLWSPALIVENTARSGSGGGIHNEGELIDVDCVPPGANVRANQPGDCSP